MFHIFSSETQYILLTEGEIGPDKVTQSYSLQYPDPQ